MCSDAVMASFPGVTPISWPPRLWPMKKNGSPGATPRASTSISARSRRDQSVTVTSVSGTA